MPRAALADKLAGRRVQRREQRGRSVPLVVVRLPVRHARSQPQHQLGAVQRVDLRLLVHAPHHRPRETVEVGASAVVFRSREPAMTSMPERLAPT